MALTTDGRQDPYKARRSPTKRYCFVAIWDDDPAALPEKGMEETDWELLSDGDGALFMVMSESAVQELFSYDLILKRKTADIQETKPMSGKGSKKKGNSDNTAQ